MENGEGHYRAGWTGRELLGWGMGLNAAYSPATNQWRPLAGTIGAPSIMVWTGRQVLTWGGGCCGEDSADGSAYTPATNSWQATPRGPLAGRHTTGAWTGTELIVVGGGNTDGKVFRDAAAYNPATNRWRALPSMEVGRIGHSAVWTGRQLLVWGGQMVRAGVRTAPPHGLAYDPAANRWSRLPTAPLRGRTGHLAVWTGNQMLVWGGQSARDPDPGQRFDNGAAYTPAGV